MGNVKEQPKKEERRSPIFRFPFYVFNAFVPIGNTKHFLVRDFHREMYRGKWIEGINERLKSESAFMVVEPKKHPLGVSNEAECFSPSVALFEVFGWTCNYEDFGGLYEFSYLKEMVENIIETIDNSDWSAYNFEIRNVPYERLEEVDVRRGYTRPLYREHSKVFPLRKDLFEFLKEEMNKKYGDDGPLVEFES